MDAVDELEGKVRRLKACEELLGENSFCVSKKELKRAQKQTMVAEGNQSTFAQSLKDATMNVRRGCGDAGSLRRLLQRRYQEDDPGSNVSDRDDDPEIDEAYTKKIQFANHSNATRAKYLGNDSSQLQSLVRGNPSADIYMLHYNEEQHRLPTWTEQLEVLQDLLETKGEPSRCCRRLQGWAFQDNLEESLRRSTPRRQHYYSESRQKREEMKGMYLLKCSDDATIDRSRTILAPLGSRVVRLKCPGPYCYDQPVTYSWSCPRCAQLVCYAAEDGVLYRG